MVLKYELVITMLTIKDLSIVADNKEILNNFNLNINDGSVPNGLLTQTIDAHCENPNITDMSGSENESDPIIMLSRYNQCF